MTFRDIKNSTFKFKNVKHSVTMKFLRVDEDGCWTLENTQYKGLLYKAFPDELEVVKWKFKDKSKYFETKTDS